MLTTLEALDARTLPFAKNVIDAQGHEHGDDGRFVMKNGERAPGHVASNLGERHAVFMIGGGGSGKGAFVRGYVGNGGEKDDHGEAIDEGHPEYVAPLEGFHPSRVFDADAEKRKIPIYTDTPDAEGKYGASGPLDADDLARYSPEEQAAVENYLRANSNFSGIGDFARRYLNSDPRKEHYGSETHYGGGLTHEISSFMAHKRLYHAMDDPEGGSFVFDSTGSEHYPEWAQRAANSGYRVTFHYVNTPVEVAQMRNAGRERVVDPARIKATHDKVQRVVPKTKAGVAEVRQAGGHAHFVTSPNYTQADVNLARERGFGPLGAGG